MAGEAVQFDLDLVESQKPKHHVVGVRLSSEDPDGGFIPQLAKFRNPVSEANRICGLTLQSRY
ncbi:hypothetical protein KC19_3G141700 [Ceratodon purpureus]|uniref:Uncharacterized protein n=1 Tax=Ceratodon purpureus TaxID=3225 RepID=A0A8T0IJN5_CERPU|nr:hypothetical protein KC19_3G141700 [Ceratodon purpureus]